MFCVFYFIKISKFALPGVMLIYERTSKDRKKERYFAPKLDDKGAKSLESAKMRVYSPLESIHNCVVYLRVNNQITLYTLSC